ncbi:MAG: transposase [Myxococcota bacterium]
MYHLVARAPKGRLLFRTWEEARTLWQLVTVAFPEAWAVCVMPNHLHVVLPHADPSDKLRRVMAGFARWRNRVRRETGAVWDPHPAPEEIESETHARRMVRYTHLNPCRARLVGDPLAWPFSTHRDAVGFARAPAIATEGDAERFHRYVSADDTVRPEGTSLPRVRFGDVAWPDVEAAVASVCRVFPHELHARGPARALVLRTASAHGVPPALAVDPATVWRHRAPPRGARYADPALDACVRAVGDARFWPLPVGDLRGSSVLGKYRWMQ